MPGPFLPYQTYAAQCALPRSGTDSITGMPYPDIQGSAVSENNWLRSWSHELYLWYDEIIDRNPAAYSTPAYFDLMKTFATTSSGAPKDRFHFSIPTEQWIALRQSGVAAGYGAEWVIVRGPPREVVVAYVQPGSPAHAVGITRGTRVQRADGVHVHTTHPGEIDVLVAALFPADVGEWHVLHIEDPGTSVGRMVTLESVLVEIAPVQNVGTIERSIGRIGYMLFTDHIATAEAKLIEAVEWLRGQSVDELVLDLRYNGGGLLAIASQLAYMIAGETATAGRVFESLRFNGKHPSTNPITGQPLLPLPFADRTLGFSAPAGARLPSLDLARVVVLTGGNTCSASETIINSLRGIGLEVIQIGATTCGKPYGSYPADNCGTTYFSTQFRTENEAGFGDYGDGFAPMNAPAPGGVRVPGCWVADDFDHALGDPDERRLAAALRYLESGTCPAPIGVAGTFSKPAETPLGLLEDGAMRKGPWLENRILDLNLD